MSTEKHVMFWGASFAAFLVFIYIFKAVLLPFVLGFAVAYLLNPVVNKLGKWGVPRGPSAILIIALFFSAVIGVLASILPLAYDQLLQLSDDFPTYLDGIWTWLQPFSERLKAFTGQGETADFQALFKEHMSSAFNVGKNVAGRLVAGGQAFMGLVSVTIFTPIVSYFVIKEWNNISEWMVGMMPRDNKNTIMNLLEQIDGKLSGFIRGQITVAFILGLAYAVALTIAGLKYGFLIGLLSGALSIIPMVGSVVGLVISVLVAWFQAGDWVFVLIIAGIFLVGQFIEGNFLTPKMMGKNVGLHPLWVFFALLAGGALFGILGMFLAVPVAAVIGVLAAFGIKKYKASSFYKVSPKKKSKGKKKNA